MQLFHLMRFLLSTPLRIFTAMKRHFLLFGLFTFLASAPLSAQIDDEPADLSSPIKERLVIGGSFGVQFGTLTMFDISPMVGYKITDRFMAGLGGTYRYYRERAGANSIAFRANIAGGSVWSRFYVLENIFAHAEFEALRIEIVGGTRRRGFFKNNALIGVGYSQPFGEKVSTFASFLFPVYTSNRDIEIYQLPVIRFGLLVHLGGQY